jgi:hypothetical protein
MGLFLPLTIIIVTLIIIIIIIIVAIVTTNKSQNSTSNTGCNNLNDCPPGFICLHDTNSNICKAGLNAPCNTDSDCIPGLFCLPNANQPPAKICLGKPISPTPVIEIPVETITIPTETAPTEVITIPIEIPIVTNPIPIEIPPEIKSIPSIMTWNKPSQHDIQPDILKMISAMNDKEFIISEHESEIQDLIQSPKNLIQSPNTPPRIPTQIIVANQYTSPYANPTNFTRNIPRRYNSCTSSFDDEINSDGSAIDGPFDIRSGVSSDDEMTSVSTPYQEQDGVYYCRNKGDIIDLSQDESGVTSPKKSHSSKLHSSVIDVCSYSDAVIFLLEDGKIICETHRKERRYRVVNNVHLIKITSFDGYIYGMGSDRKLYTLPNNFFPTTNWVWSLVEWAPIYIQHISSTYDTSHLWIQTQTIGYLYNSKQLISNLPYTNSKRIYGRDVNHYIDIDTSRHTARIHHNNSIVPNVYDGVLSYYDELIAIHPSERNTYRGITIVNWHPYYIRA